MVCTENDQYCDPSKKIQENINASKISTLKTWSILRPSLFFIGRWTKVFGAEKGGKKSFFHNNDRFHH